MHDLPRQKLRELLDKYGLSLAEDSRRCEGLLRDHCPAQRREVFLLVNAQREHVPADLLAWPGGTSADDMLVRIARRLQDNLALDAAAAQWAVETWAVALGVVDEAALRRLHTFHLETSASLAETPVKPDRAMLVGTSSVLKLVTIPAGQFWMGSESCNDEGPRHRVTITKPFQMGALQVTQEEFQSVLGRNPSKFKASFVHLDKNRPVESVTWFDAVQFCNQLSRLEGRSPSYHLDVIRRSQDQHIVIAHVSMLAGNGYRLPTEAQWEYACRAGSTGEWWFGDDAKLLGCYAWYTENSDRKTHPVGQKRPNGWGLQDMHGNVREWVQDWYDVGCYARSPAEDPPGPSAGHLRVCRGGGWRDDTHYCRSAARGHGDPVVPSDDIGFRVVVS